MTPTDFAAKLKALIDAERIAFFDPGYDDFMKYREGLARHGAYVNALEKLRLTINEDDE